MKKTLYALLSISLLFVLSSCGGSTGEIVSDVMHKTISLDEAVANSDCGIIGRYTGIEEYEEYVFYHFDVVDLVCGSLDLNEVSVYAIRTNTDMSDRYEEGEDYILTLYEEEVVLFDTERRFISPSSEMMFPVDGPFTMYGEELDFDDAAELTDYIASAYDLVEHEIVAEAVVEYASDAERIEGESQYIGYVTIEGLDFEGGANTNTYTCTVTGLVKGESLNTRTDGTILMSIVKDTVEVGETYFIGFNPADVDSVIYVQAGFDFVVEDIEIEAAIIDALD